MTYPVHEMFKSFQGEGVHAGRSAFFVRLFGCPVHCPWCDSASTWHPNHVPKDIARLTAEEIAKAACTAQPEFVVLTGGEPTIHNLNQLTFLVGNSFYDVHLETSGAFPLKGDFDWITLSPKKWKVPLVENVQQADEFKIIVEQPEDIAFYVHFLEECFLPNGEIPHPIWLHPEWSQRNNKVVLDAITKAVVDRWRGHPFRAGWQLHKLYQADLLDPGSRPAVPLGGNPEKGF